MTELIEEKEPYANMVTGLFKTEGFHSNHNALMHAAIGICGEVGELIEAVDVDDSIKCRQNVVEELGDIHFYMVALELVTIHSPHYKRNELLPNNPTFSPGNSKSLLLSLSVESSNILDIVKKGWVYGKDIDLVKLLDAAAIVIYLIGTLAERLKISTDEILEANRIKLTGKGGRYENGYTDQAAQGRADKVGE